MLFQSFETQSLRIVNLQLFNVMAGLVPAIHVFALARLLKRGCPA
jgi:hypothetical protein